MQGTGNVKLRIARGLASFVCVCSIVLAVWGSLAVAGAQEVASPIAEPPMAQPGDGDQTEDISSNATSNFFGAELWECGTTDPSLANTFDFTFSSDVTGAATGTNCDDIPNPTSWSLVLDGESQITYPFDSNSDILQSPGPEEGTYAISLFDGVTTYSLGGSIVVYADSSDILRITHYVAAPELPTPDPTANTGVVYGNFEACLDASRDGETDFLLSPVYGAGSGNCESVQHNGDAVQLQGTDSNGNPFGPILSSNSSGTFGFSDVPYGVYTMTDLNSGVTSDEFVLDGTTSDGYIVARIVTYYAEEFPPALPRVEVVKYFCQDSTREGDTEFIVNTSTDFLALDTSTVIEGTSCIVDPDAGMATIDVTLTSVSDPGFPDQTRSIQPGGPFGFAPVVAGTYTLREQSTGYPEPASSWDVTSSVLTFEPATSYRITIINYVASGSGLEEPVESDDPAFFSAILSYCSSAEREGQVDFLIDTTAFGGADTGISHCQYAAPGQGQVVLYQYEDESGSGDPIAVYQGFPGSQGYYGFGSYDDDPQKLTSGWYRLVFRDSGFPEQEYLSQPFSIIANYSNEQSTYYRNYGEIYAYVAPVSATNITVNKSLCHAPDRAGTTDFYINLYTGYPYVDAVETTTCRYVTSDDDLDITFTLVNEDTGDRQDAFLDNAFWAPFRYTFWSVPAGTYHIEEVIASGLYSAQSESFTVDPAAGYPVIEVHNNTSDPIDVDVTNGEQDIDANITVRAFVCESEAFETRFEYFYYPYGEYGGYPYDQIPASIDGAASGDTEHCRAATLGEFDFVLEGTPDPVEDASLSAAETFQLTQDPDNPVNFFYANSDTNNAIPAGTYLIRDLITGSTSGTVHMANWWYGVGEGSQLASPFAEFYFFPAAPTPTPTATATATATVTATATATATATDPGSTPPTATSTQAIPTREILPGRTPDPTATKAPTGGVSVLPSTGQNPGSNDGTGLYLLLGLALGLIFAAAAITRRTRRQ